MSQKKVTIAGAGLVGSLAGLFLAKRGIPVEVFEKRPDMRKEKVAAGRSINLAISRRGLYALEKVGLADEVLSRAVPMKGRMIHSTSGAEQFQAYGRDEGLYINSVGRADLNSLLMDELERHSVKIHFSHRLRELDTSKQELHFENGTSLNYEVLIGTDGSSSKVRESLASSKFIQTKEEFLNHGYKELSIFPGPGNSFRMDQNALHIWPRKNFMLIALPNKNGSFTCTLFLPLEGPDSFETLHSEEEVHSFFADHFPDAVHLIPNLEEEFFENPTGRLVTVRSSEWNHDNVLLIGDAAHAIVPFFGQGMNAGFEDVSVFDEVLGSETQENTEQLIQWEKLFATFSQLRKTHCDAIAEMALENFIEMRDHVGDPKFLRKKAFERELERRFPDRYVSRYSMVSFGRTPYRVALEAGKIQDEILNQLCSGQTKPEELDEPLAESLITEKLTPFFNEHPPTV